MPRTFLASMTAMLTRLLPPSPCFWCALCSARAARARSLCGSDCSPRSRREMALQEELARLVARADERPGRDERVAVGLRARAERLELLGGDEALHGQV